MSIFDVYIVLIVVVVAARSISRIVFRKTADFFEIKICMCSYESLSTFVTTYSPSRLFEIYSYKEAL